MEDPYAALPGADLHRDQRGVRASRGVRFDSVVRYVGYVEPVAVYVDYDIIQNGPKDLNRSGVCDVLCYNNSMFDWKYAADQGNARRSGPMRRWWQRSRRCTTCGERPG